MSAADNGSMGTLTVSSLSPLLGTDIVVRLHTTGGDPDDAIADLLFDEMIRLEGVFNVYDPGSELSRWRSGRTDLAPSSELSAVLDLAGEWFRRGSGAFNPSIARLLGCWRSAEAAAVAPTGATLQKLSADIATLAYRIDDGVAVRTGPCDSLDLNAIAKGWIVDRAVELAMRQPEVSAVTVNAGGDLRHCGAGSVRVGVEDPRRVVDNRLPSMAVELAELAIATNGLSRRGVSIGGRWYGHVIDPRSGRPVERVLSASVIAADAATADVVATIVGVLDGEERQHFIDGLDRVGCCIITSDGEMWRNQFWLDHEVTSTAP